MAQLYWQSQHCAEGIQIDSEFVETLQKQKHDAEEALKAAKLLAAVSGNTFMDPDVRCFCLH